MSSRLDQGRVGTSKFSFAALDIEGDDSDSVTESDAEEPPKVESPQPPKEPTPPAEKLPKAKAPKTKLKTRSKTSNDETASILTPLQPTSGSSEIGNGIAPPKATAGEFVLSNLRPPAEIAKSPVVAVKSRRRSISPKSSSVRFQPTLPKLPAPPPSPGLGLRKRKASQDLIANPLNKELKIASDEEGAVNGEAREDVEPPAPIDPNAERAKKKQNAVTRTIWTLIMIFGFMGLLLMGHPWVIVLVFCCQGLVYREVTALFSLTHPKPGQTRSPWDSTLNWFFFAVTNYFLYGESIIYYFKHVVFSDAQFLPFATNHRFISFMLYIIGFVGFVASLKKQYLKYQFGLFGWVHMTLLVIVVSSHFIVNNILEGLIWFWLPASLVICNDIFAYVCGITFGKTPLIKLSPKKTVEGFVGAFICTLIFGVLWATLFMRYPYMICPVRDLGTHAWSNVSCRPNSVFIWRQFELWGPFNAFLSYIFRAGHPLPPISYAPFQLHAIAMATFASLVAPFGGFFASGFKRAFDIKDFGDSIPGHGGMTDRMDCQFMMGMFSYVYYSALVREHHVTVGSVLQTIVSSLAAEEQLELFLDLKRYLEGSGISIPA